MSKFIFVAGGVMSGIGKGVATSSIGRILTSRGYNVTAIKIDPYINVDAGTMNPVEHGEVFVTEDGLECDQDVGNYERFLDKNIYSINYMTTGRVYESVIHRERNLGYGGRQVTVVPDIPEEVIRRISKVSRQTKADFVMVEIGGTVGEYENLLFLEAARMMYLRRPKDVLFILVSYLPVPKMIGEMKTKPTQHAVRSLNSAGIQPHIILARSEYALDEPRKKKVSIYCNIAPNDVISAPDVESIYEVPLNFEKENLGKRILAKFEMRGKGKNLEAWEKLVNTIQTSENPVKLGIVGKYFESGAFTLSDSYISVIEALKHACWFHKRKPEISWLNSDHYEKFPESLSELKDFDGIIVPGGFGSRGVEGKIMAAGFCRSNNIPYLGLCYGMQIATIEFARTVCKLDGANTSEIDKKTPHPVIDVMPEQKTNIQKKDYGASMRLGAYNCLVKRGSVAHRAYSKGDFEKEKEKNGDLIISERHRHRYELNNNYRESLEKEGLLMSGINPERNLVEIIELPNHKFFVGTQFHPEFKSRPLRPHPLFVEFIRAAIS
ncbi:MAG: CTP synthase [Candidatus Spechtbacteria bacterium RIFCSPHIGHO2_01_FULL_43_30]|uniref:CTP synthase n=1 Tax=Candidatus Spechtbacteria bacterium RIFCSPHIGHO2_01_FULL_43_30 TaxID=1802158 RepID=A0A1G2H4V6_9BACT|nr:MAG: CTP synthase [Candidatus Spechtbacteria bacterium RIFCSPHIGHO2_01_FULL_43_30]